MSDAESLTKKRAAILAEQDNCSPGYADGYIDGEYHRRRGAPLGAYLMVGIDDFALGFRAGYFKRKTSASTQSPPAGSAKTKQEHKNVD